MRSKYARRIRFEQLQSRNMLAVFIPGDYNDSGVVDNNGYTEPNGEQTLVNLLN